MTALSAAPLDDRLRPWQVRLLLHVACVLRDGAPQPLKHEALAHALRMRRAHVSGSLSVFVQCGYLERVAGTRPSVYRSAPDLWGHAPTVDQVCLSVVGFPSPHCTVARPLPLSPSPLAP